MEWAIAIDQYNKMLACDVEKRLGGRQLVIEGIGGIRATILNELVKADLSNKNSIAAAT